MKQKWITTDIDSLDIPDGINRIYQGEIDGIHIKKVFSPETMARVKENCNLEVMLALFSLSLY